MSNHFGKITNLFIVILLSSFLFSCIATKPLYVEISQKPKKELPANIQSLLLVTRVVDYRYTDLEEDSLQRIFYKQSFNYDTLIHDLQMVDTMLQALGELLYESERYDIVIPEDRHLDFERSRLIVKEMTWDEVKILCETFETDAILSLDYMKTKVYTSFDKNSEYNIRSDNFENFVEAEMKVAYEALFRIYNPLNEKITYRKFLRDTIYWGDADYTIERLFNRFTPVKQGLTESGIAMALDISDEISPGWRREKRSYFASGNQDMKTAAQFVNSGEWESAIEIWLGLIEQTKSKSLKSKAEYNISFAYEMLGDIDLSIEWIVKSYETMYRTNTVNYMEILKRRQRETNIR